jgi:DNA-directed RNA polymerase sigma subunit (sigma70/sigma32)
MAEIASFSDFADASDQPWNLYTNMSDEALANFKAAFFGMADGNGQQEEMDESLPSVEDFQHTEGGQADKASSENEKRIRTVRHLVRLFGDEPEVLLALEHAKSKPHPLVYSENATSQFMRAVGQYDPPTEAEYIEYFTAINDALDLYDEEYGDNLDPVTLSPEDRQTFIDAVISRQLLMIKNQRLLFIFARPYLARKHPGLGEMVQEANIGLARAVALHDVTKGVFPHYAKWNVKNSIHGVLGNNTGFRLPKNVYEEWYPVMAQVETLRTELQREPTTDEVVKRSGINAEKVAKMRAIPNDPLHLDSPFGLDGDETLGDVIADRKDEEDEIDMVLRRINIAGIFNSDLLNDKEKLVLGLTYGLFEKIPDDLYIEDPKTGEPIDYQSRIREQLAVIADEYRNREQWWLKRENHVGLEPKHITKILDVPNNVLANIKNKALAKAGKVLVSNLTRKQ